MDTSSSTRPRLRAGILGIGLDADDGHTRITRGREAPEITLVGGSEQTHQLMQQQVALFTDAIKKTGKTLDELTEADLDKLISDLGAEFELLEVICDQESDEEVQG